MKKTIIITISFTLGALLGLIIMVGLFMDEHEEITTEGIQVEETNRYQMDPERISYYYPNGTDRMIKIHGSYEDCAAYFERLGLTNWVSAGGENDEWICYFNSKDLYIH